MRIPKKTELIKNRLNIVKAVLIGQPFFYQPTQGLRQGEARR